MCAFSKMVFTLLIQFQSHFVVTSKLWTFWSTDTQHSIVVCVILRAVKKTLQTRPSHPKLNHSKNLIKFEQEINGLIGRLEASNWVGPFRLCAEWSATCSPNISTSKNTLSASCGRLQRRARTTKC